MLTQGTNQRKERQRAGGIVLQRSRPVLPFAKPGCLQLSTLHSLTLSQNLCAASGDEVFSLFIRPSQSTIYNLEGVACEIWQHPARKSSGHPSLALIGPLCGCLEGKWV